VRVADDYPTEFSARVARALGAERQFGSFLLHRSGDELVVGEIGAAFIDEVGTLEIGYAVVESQRNRGYATAAVDALVAKVREASEVRRIVAHTPLERPQSGRVVEKAGFTMVRETDDVDAAGNVLRVKEWELGALAPRPESDRGARRSALVGDVPYSSSVTCRPHLTRLPDSSFCCTARWTMKRLGAAPCQWFSPGSKKTRSPGRMISTGPPSRWQRPTPSVKKMV
jgi:GNAT superfamily N-acetyltransferase